MAGEDARELLDSGAVPPELAALVQAWQIEDLPVDRLYFGAWELVYRLLLESPAARQMGTYIFSQAMRFSSMRAWMRWASQFVLNALAGQDLFPATLPDA